MAEQPPSQAVTVEFSKDPCNTASGMSCSVPHGSTVVLLIPGSTSIYSNDVIHSTCEKPPCNQGMLASVVFQCQRLQLVTSDAELQSNGVNDDGTTESRGLHG